MMFSVETVSFMKCIQQSTVTPIYTYFYPAPYVLFFCEEEKSHDNFRGVRHDSRSRII